MQLSKKALGISPSLTLGISAMASEMKKRGEDVISFGIGEPDFDTPDYIKRAAVLAIQEGRTKYTPVAGIPELKKAICDRYFEKYGLKYDPSQVVVSNGAKQALFNIFQSILNPGDEVILLAPYWLTYPEQVRMADGVPVFVQSREEDGFQADPAAIEAAVTKKTRAILLNSPSNPGGNVYGKKVLEQIARIARENDLYIISDEIYDELVYDVKTISPATLSQDAKARTIIVNGVSKTFAMTGWRIGYAISDPALAKVMASYQSHSTSNACSISQYAALAAFQGLKEDLRCMVCVFAARAKLLYELINEIPGLSCQMPKGAFYVFANIRPVLGKKYNGQTITDSVKFCELLLKEKLVAAVPGIAFGTEGYVRISYATSEMNIQRGLARIGEFFKNIV